MIYGPILNDHVRICDAPEKQKISCELSSILPHMRLDVVDARRRNATGQSHPNTVSLETIVAVHHGDVALMKRKGLFSML